MAELAEVMPRESLMQVERRIQELERVRAAKPAGSWLYELDTNQIQRLRAIRDQIIAATTIHGQYA